MMRRSLLARLDLTRIEAVIAEAERGTSAELRVAVAGLFWGRARSVAERAFGRMGMRATQSRNGVLLFVIPWRRRLEIVADDAAAAAIAPAFWQAVVDRVRVSFAAERYTEGLLDAVATIGAELAGPFPPPKTGRNVNELPDQVDVGGRPPSSAPDTKG